MHVNKVSHGNLRIEDFLLDKDYNIKIANFEKQDYWPKEKLNQVGAINKCHLAPELYLK